jgi:lipoate---protein ligase
MSAPMRLLDTGLRSARRNVAITTALTELHRAGQTPDTLRLYTCPSSVLVGRHQRLTDAVRVKTCRRSHVEIARRVTDGGAVYMSPGVLAWEVVAEPHRFGVRLAEIGERICSAVAAGLARFGLPARFRPLGDVEIDGRVIAQSSGVIEGPTVVFQGTVLVEVEREKMLAVLRQTPAARDKQIQDRFLQRITSLSEWLGRVPSMHELQGLLVAGLAHGWRCELWPGRLTPAEIHLVDRLLAQGIGTDGYAHIAPATDIGMQAS